MEPNDNSDHALDIDFELPVRTLWTPHYETILAEWSDKAMSYRWMHRNCNSIYAWRNAMFTIPVITLSTVTGTANFAMEHFDEEYRNYMPMVIGALNICAGIVGTVHQYLKVAETCEGHRVAYIAWDKFYRTVKLELAKPPTERSSVHDFVRVCKEDYDRLMETSPRINDVVVRQFMTAFKNDNFAFPEVCNKMRSTHEYIYSEAHEDMVHV